MVVGEGRRALLGRLVVLLVLVVLAASATAAGPASGAPVTAASAAGGVAEERLLGSSVLGRPIVAWQRRGSGPARHIAVVGVVHGDEPAGRAVIDALLATTVPANLTLTLIPTMNPDGEALGRRGNANGVDLNRNFPFAWAAAGTSPFTGGAEHPGPAPLSEPESVAVQRWLWAARPDFVLWYHQPWGAVVCGDGADWQCPAFAAGTGLPVIAAPRPGSAAQWASANGMPSAVVELPEHGLGPDEVARHVAAITALHAKVAPQSRLPPADLSAGLLPAARLQPLDAPVRALDTREAGAPIAPGGLRRVALPSGIADAGATAASVTVVAVEPQGAGYLAIGPDDGTTSVLNFQADSPATSQHLDVPLDAGPAGPVGFDVSVAGAATHLVIDVDAIWSTGPGGARFDPGGPRRVLDTREEGSPLIGDRRFVVPGLPADAEAVELHVTAIGEAWLSVRPGDRPWPGTSSLNVHHGTSDGSVTARVSDDGAVWLYAPVANHVIVDVVGAHRSSTGLSYRAATRPTRVFDSRLHSGSRPAGPIDWDESWALGLDTMPTNAGAASLNVTSVGGGGGWTVLWGAGPRPWASIAQHVPGTYAAASQGPVAVVDGSVQAYSTAVGAHVGIDHVGAFVTS